MTNALGRPVTIWLALLACLVVTSLPSSAFRLNHCDCGVVALEAVADGDVCPCRDPQPQPCCPQPEEPVEDDSCCTDDPLPPLLNSGSGSSSGGTDDAGADAADGPPDAGLVPTAAPVRRGCVRATGPPFVGHRTRRALLERDTVVLLI